MTRLLERPRDPRSNAGLGVARALRLLAPATVRPAKRARSLTSGTLLGGPRLTSMRFTWTPTVDHYHAWASHFRQKGWLERPFDYTRDEPPQGCSWSQITSRASLVRSGDPELKTLVTTSLQEAATLTCHWLWRKTGQELPLFVAELGGECRVGIHQ